MLIARTLDALTSAPHPASAAGSGVAADLRSSVILACQCRPMSIGPADARLCIKQMRRGIEEHRLAQRRLTLDEDAYLILNGCARGSSVYRGDGIAWPFAVFFGRDMLAQALTDPLPDDAGDDGAASARSFGFLEHLRPHGDDASRRLRLIARQVDAGLEDPLWYEEQLIGLLRSALMRERELQRRSHRIASVKAATRHELLRRVLLAADFIWSNYEQAITLDDIAGAARLSRFHLVRLFRQVQGVTPHGYLMAKRLAVAERMLAGTQLDLNDIALRAGFGTRWSLFRELRRRRGAGGEALRHGLEAPRDDADRHPAPLTDRTPCPISA
jgi:AraC family transcriptional regulator